MQSEAINVEVAEAEMTVKTTSSEMKDVKSSLQALEIELQSQLSMVRTRINWFVMYIGAANCQCALGRNLVAIGSIVVC
jgi:hypothetical protein